MYSNRPVVGLPSSAWKTMRSFFVHARQSPRRRRAPGRDASSMRPRQREDCPWHERFHGTAPRLPKRLRRTRSATSSHHSPTATPSHGSAASFRPSPPRPRAAPPPPSPRRTTANTSTPRELSASWSRFPVTAAKTSLSSWRLSRCAVRSRSAPRGSSSSSTPSASSRTPSRTRPPASPAFARRRLSSSTTPTATSAFRSLPAASMAAVSSGPRRDATPSSAAPAVPATRCAAGCAIQSPRFATLGRLSPSRL